MSTCVESGYSQESIVELIHSPHRLEPAVAQYPHGKCLMQTKSEPKNFKNNKFVYLSRDKLRSGLHESFGKQKSFSILRGC
jgi:hypothetical protein